MDIMASSGQRKGGCGHVIANFDTHIRCARCREKGSGSDSSHPIAAEAIGHAHL